MKIKGTLKKRISVNLFLGILISTLSISCDFNTNNVTAKKNDAIEGVWELSAFYNLANGDTLIVDTNKVQHKIYLNGYVLWNADPAPDASEWHGYGTYTYKNDTIIEILSSMSKSMKSDVNKYIIPIERGNKTYKQVNTYKNNDTIFQNIEVYKKLN